MKKITYFEIESNPLEDIEVLKTELSKLNKYKFKVFNTEYEQKKQILEYGLSKIINPEYSEFLGTPKDNINKFIETFQKFLDNVIIGKELIIIDNYIFPKNADNDYHKLLLGILNKYITKTERIIFITKKKFNAELQLDIFSEIKNINSNITLEIKHSELFHDRFWLSSSNGKGAFVGTSLNGFGKKYTLIDYIDNEDVKLIYKELNQLILI